MAAEPTKLEASSVGSCPTGALVVWRGHADFYRGSCGFRDSVTFVLSAAGCEWARGEATLKLGRPVFSSHNKHLDMDFYSIEAEISVLAGEFPIHDEFFRFSVATMQVWGGGSYNSYFHATEQFGKGSVAKVTFLVGMRTNSTDFRLEMAFTKVKKSGSLTDDLLAAELDFSFVCGPEKTKVACGKVIMAARSGMT